MNKVDKLIKMEFEKLKIKLEDISAKVMADMEEEVRNFRKNVKKKLEDIIEVDGKKI